MIFWRCTFWYILWGLNIARMIIFPGQYAHSYKVDPLPFSPYGFPLPAFVLKSAA